MIIVKLQGGLGNQMFQYAAGRALAEKQRQSLLLDISSLTDNEIGITPRVYRLGNFNIKAGIADSETILSFRKKLGVLNKILNKFRPNHKKGIYTHPDFAFDRNFPRAGRNIWLVGYWQSYLYFEKIQQIIRDEFSLNEIDYDSIGPILKQIDERPSVSLHIRRGDYVTSKVASDVLGCLPINYYENAIQIIRKRVKDPYFFIFSDDPEWVKENMRIENSRIVENENDLSDLVLMSHCKHNVIANSSFSWWAAWLNDNSEKIVIGPKLWFKDLSINTNDLLLPEWIRV